MSEILLVCGHGRCGSSLTMQMLHAGGYPVVGEWPGYEPFEGGYWHHSPEAWAREADGRAFKLLEPQLWPPPEGPSYRAIWLRRDRKQQAKSALKMVGATMPVTPTRFGIGRLAQSYAEDTPTAWRQLKAAGVVDMLILNFERLIDHPRASAISIAQWIGRDLDIDAMVRQVVPREAGCLPFLMEALQCERADMHRVSGLAAKMAEIRRCPEMPRDLANRWFQPLTHVSGGGFPKVSGTSVNRGSRETRQAHRFAVAQSAAHSVRPSSTPSGNPSL